MRHIQSTKNKRGFTIVELLIVIIVIAILAALTAVAFNGIKARADKSAMAADLNNINKLIRNYESINGTYPTSLSQLNDGNGYTPSKDNTIRLSGGSSYCATVIRNEQYMKYDGTAGATSDGYCAGHGPQPPAQIAYSSGMTSYPTASTTYPLTPSVALQAGDVVISFHSEHYIVGTAYMKLNGVNQTAVMSQSLGSGSKVYRVSILNNITSSTSLSFTTDGSGVEMAYFVVRGLTNPTTYTSQTAGWSGSTVPGGTTVTPASQPIKAGQVAIMAANATTTTVTLPTNPTPAIGNWTVLPVGPGLIRAMGYVIGTNDMTSVSAGATTSGSNFLGAAIFVLGS